MPSRKAATPGLLLLLTGCCLITQGTYQEVKINSDPQGALFKFEGKEYRTPDTVNLPKKEITLVLSKQGYEDASYDLKLRTSLYFYGSLLSILSGGIDWLTGAGMEFESAEVTVPLKERGDIPIEKELTVDSDPPGAAIHISGDVHGMTKKKLNLRWVPGEREKRIVLKLPKYEDLALAVRREGPASVTGTLVPKPDLVTVQFVSFPHGARVRVEEHIISPTPKTHVFPWFRDTPPREAVFELEGYVAKKQTFTRDTRKIIVQLEEEVRRVTVKLDTIPAGAHLEVDGAPVGPAPGELSLAWTVSRIKDYTLVFSCPGYKSESFSVSETRKEVKVHLRPMLPKLP
ncbi:MAG TPA: PEGA domain-containing protein [Planctomycetota bacterium]|nr:PEGA domain-containing protein [Planctomycetota bacterium]